MPGVAQWPSLGTPLAGLATGTLSAGKVVPREAQLCAKGHADKTITRNAGAAGRALPISHLVFNAVKRQELSRLANCSKVIVQNYRIFRAIFFDKEN